MVSTPKLTLQSKIKLNDGHDIPALGLGVYEMSDEEAYQATKWALEAGYRLVDTAAWYENEAPCGRAILDFCKETGTPRSEIYYTTKLKENLGHAATLRSIQTSLTLSGLSYIDLYLIHGPLGGPSARAESWSACVEAQKEGLVRSIGVSNYGVKHLQEMAATSKWDEGGARPSVNQVDLHPFMTRDDIVEFCREHDIVLEAWAPLVRALRFDNPVLNRIAKAHNVSPAQILLRYSLQRGYVAIPKSVSQGRIKANADLYGFELSEEELATLHGLNENLFTDWDVTEVE